MLKGQLSLQVGGSYRAVHRLAKRDADSDVDDQQAQELLQELSLGIQLL